MSKFLALRMFWMRFTSSRAIPSLSSSSVSVMSKATVRLPSLATSQPGMSSLITSTSARSTVMGVPATSNVACPVFSKAIMSGCSICDRAAATAFMFLPSFLPSTLKSGLTRLTRMPASLATSFTSLTLTSPLMSSATASRAAFCLSSTTGTMMLMSGWRTFRFCLRRRASTIDVVSCASCMRSSS